MAATQLHHESDDDDEGDGDRFGSAVDSAEVAKLQRKVCHVSLYNWNMRCFPLLTLSRSRFHFFGGHCSDVYLLA